MIYNHHKKDGDMNKIEREYNKNKQSIRVEEEFDFYSFNDFVNSIARFAAKYNVDISDVGIDKRVVDDYDDTRGAITLGKAKRHEQTN